MPWAASAGRFGWRREASCPLGLALALATGLAFGATTLPPARDASARGLIVQLHTAATAEATRRVLRAAGVDATELHPVGGQAHLVEFGRRLSADEAAALAARLRERPEVAWVVPNEREHRLDAPNDPLFAASATSSGQWWLFPVAGSDANAIADRRRGVPGIQSAWTLQHGGPAAVVAVLDTGITPHPDLEGHVLPGYDFVSDPQVANDGDGRDADPSDPGDWVTHGDQQASPPVFRDCAVQPSSWHGTEIAGIVAAVANNSTGVAGIAWDGRVLPVRVAGKCGADVADIVDGMRWAAGLPVAGVPANPNPARIISISFGGSAPCNAAYQAAIDDIVRLKGAVVVAAAGNDRGGPTRPASCGGVIGVAALNRDGFKATYSSVGPQLAVATVGGDPAGQGRWGGLLGDDGVLTIDNSGAQAPGSATYNRVYGTSFAAPIVAGVVSLMLSANPGLSAAQIVHGLRITARPHVVSPHIDACGAQNPGRCACTTSTCGAGILDAEQAVLYAAAPAAYVAPAAAAAVLDSAELETAAAYGADATSSESSQNSPALQADHPGGGTMGLGGLLGVAVAVALLRRGATKRPAGRGRSPCRARRGEGR